MGLVHEQEVYVSDEFTIDCPHPKCNGGRVPSAYGGTMEITGNGMPCPVCEETGVVDVYVEGETLVILD